MGDIGEALTLMVRELSDKNYKQSLPSCRFWLEFGQTYSQIPPDPIFNAIWNGRTSSSIDPVGRKGNIVHPAAHLVLRLASDAESDPILAPHSSGVQSRLYTRVLREFFINNVKIASNPHGGIARVNFCADANLIAHWANLGYVEEVVIRNHILQPLISLLGLHDHQANALLILFKLAGATFSAYVDPSVVDRCFELLKGRDYSGSWKETLVKEVFKLRECGWEGLPPPPVFRTWEPKPTGTDEKDPASTPTATLLGLPSRDPEPHILQTPPLEPTANPEIDTVPGSLVVHSPSISISTLSDFTIADTSDGEPPTDSTTITPHDTFYFEDGNVEVLCGNTLFRVHASILSLHSPVLSQMFAKASLSTAESPNGCPQIPSSDTVTDFATLLKVICLPEFPDRNKVPNFITFSSLLRITAKYEMSTVRSRLLEVIRDAYPVAFEGLDPSKALGETVFSGPTPHPTAVLNLFIQQKLTSALPMAYYMAVRRGPDSLMDARFPASARLPPGILQVAIKGLFTLREMELRETNRLILGPKDPHLPPFSCSSCDAAGPRVSEAHQKVIDQIASSSRSGTRLLQVLSLGDICGGDYHGFCESCVKGWEYGHAEVRKKAWAALPRVFGLGT